MNTKSDPALPSEEYTQFEIKQQKILEDLLDFGENEDSSIIMILDPVHGVFLHNISTSPSANQLHALLHASDPSFGIIPAFLDAGIARIKVQIIAHMSEDINIPINEHLNALPYYWANCPEKKVENLRGTAIILFDNARLD